MQKGEDTIYIHTKKEKQQYQAINKENRLYKIRCWN